MMGLKGIARHLQLGGGGRRPSCRARRPAGEHFRFGALQLTDREGGGHAPYHVRRQHQPVAAQRVAGRWLQDGEPGNPA